MKKNRDSEVEEKESPAAPLPSSPSFHFNHMNTTQESASVQTHLEQFLSQAAQTPELAVHLSPQDLPHLLQLGFARMLEAALDKERQWHLADHPADRANGYAPPRTLHVGTTPVPLERPRTRQGFYPAVLPKHQRHLPEAYQQLLQNILLGAKSFAAARRSLQALGLGYSPEQVEGLLEELHQQARAFFGRPLAPDWFCLFADAKVIQLKDEQDQVKPAVHFLVLGLNLEGRKELLTATTFWGHEVLDAWRQVLVGLRNRGLLRVLLLVTDDFSGLAPMVKSLFPNTDHQLCTVHLFRNAQRHLGAEDYTRFREAWRDLYAASSFETAQAKLRQLCDQLRPNNPTYIQHLEKRIAHYLAFFKYPQALRAQLRTTNLPEGLNNQIENLRRNAGGHFHSQREALIKMKLLADQLYAGPWSRVSPTIKASLPALTHLFHQRFESEINDEHFLTQSF
jgi:transposase-like protein